jgi:hypothetical protein
MLWFAPRATIAARFLDHVTGYRPFKSRETGWHVTLRTALRCCSVSTLTHTALRCRSVSTLTHTALRCRSVSTPTHAVSHCQNSIYTSPK